MIGEVRTCSAVDLTGVVFRAEDEAECQASSGFGCRDAVLYALSEGSAVQLVTDPRTGKPFAFFGALPVGDEAALVWMLGTDALARNARTLHAHTPAVLDRWHAERPLLFNYVDARNDLHIRWLRRLGFTFIKLHACHGHEQRPFYEFVRLPHV